MKVLIGVIFFIAGGGPSIIRAIIANCLVYSFYNCTRFSLSELLITETELKLIAAAAMIGDNKIPKNGYSTPAAIGMPAVL